MVFIDIVLTYISYIIKFHNAIYRIIHYWIWILNIYHNSISYPKVSQSGAILISTSASTSDLRRSFRSPTETAFEDYTFPENFKEAALLAPYWGLAILSDDHVSINYSVVW